jgi:hypothetical protein
MLPQLSLYASPGRKTRSLAATQTPPPVATSKSPTQPELNLI